MVCHVYLCSVGWADNASACHVLPCLPLSSPPIRHLFLLFNFGTPSFPHREARPARCFEDVNNPHNNGLDDIDFPQTMRLS